jgi:quinolinate synthase
MVPEKEIVLWPGFCVVHEKADPVSVLKAKSEHPDAKVLAHPECPSEILDIADAVLSTGQMFSYVENNPLVRDFIIVTEWGINYSLKKMCGRNFIEPSKRMECSNMKRITADKLLKSIITLDFKVKVDPSLASRALIPIEKMLEVMN